jgi:hypothetical protein
MDSPDSPAAEGDSASGDPSLLDCDDSNMDTEQIRKDGRFGTSTSEPGTAPRIVGGFDRGASGSGGASNWMSGNPGTSGVKSKVRESVTSRTSASTTSGDNRPSLPPIYHTV